MKGQLKKYLIWAIAGVAFYFVLSHHFIIVGKSIKLLSKAKLSMNYTIFSTKGMSNKAILSIPELRAAGMGALLLKTGKISEEELEAFMDQLREKEEQDRH